MCIQALKDASQRCPACRTAIDWDAIPSVSALPTNENRLDPRPREHRAESAVHPGAPGGPLLGAAPGLDEDTELQLATMLSELESVRDVDDDMQLAMELSRAEAASRAGPGPSDRHDHFDEDFQRAVEESLRAAEAGPRQGRGRPPPPPMFPPAASGRRPEESVSSQHVRARLCTQAAPNLSVSDALRSLCTRRVARCGVICGWPLPCLAG